MYCMTTKIKIKMHTHSGSAPVYTPSVDPSIDRSEQNESAKYRYSYIEGWRAKVLQTHRCHAPRGDNGLPSWNLSP